MSLRLRRPKTISDLADMTGRMARFNLSDKTAKQREKVENVLERLVDRLQDDIPSNIQRDILNALPVELRDLDIEDEEKPGPLYFRPWTASKMAEHAKNMESEKVRKTAERKGDLLVRGTPLIQRRGGWETWMWASCMCTLLRWEVQDVPRMGTRGDSQPLVPITEWNCLEGLPDDTRFQPHFCANQGSWYPKYCWVRRSKYEQPHIKICMYHDIAGDPELVLREELLTIVAAMISRLGKRSFKKHVIFPVMLVSVMGERHGRILIAYFDGKNLVVHKSRLYRFIAQGYSSESRGPQTHSTRAPGSYSPVSPSDDSLSPASTDPSSLALSPIFSRSSHLSPTSSVGHPLSSSSSGSNPLNPRGLFLDSEGALPQTRAPQGHDSNSGEFLNHDVVELFTRYIAADIDTRDDTMRLAWAETV